MHNSDLEFVGMLKEKQSVCSGVAVSGDPVKGDSERRMEGIMKEEPASDAVHFIMC